MSKPLDDSPGNRELLPLLIERWSPSLRDYIRLKIPSRMRRVVSEEDILQDVWLDAARQLDDFTPYNDGALYQWLERIAMGKTADAVRKHHTERRGGRAAFLTGAVKENLSWFVKLFFSPVKTASRDAATNEARESIQRALDELDEPDQKIMRLYYEGLTPHQIADQTNLSLGTVRGVIYRTRKKLKQRLGNSEKFFSNA